MIVHDWRLDDEWNALRNRITARLLHSRLRLAQSADVVRDAKRLVASSRKRRWRRLRVVRAR